MKSNLKQTLAAVLAALLLAGCLTGCGSKSEDGYDDVEYKSAPYVLDEKPAGAEPVNEDPVNEEPVSEEPVDEKPVDEKPVDEKPVDEEPAGTSTSAEINPAEKDISPKPEKPMSDMDAIKELINLIGNWSAEARRSYKYQIEIDTNENPYGLTWKYKPEGRANRLYENYVNACDWSLVFDVEFYKQAFPMLALQYNYDDMLLAQHFMTAGVHEGRQGSEAFNPAAYMANCDESVKNAFGDNYECYYFYYMLNQDSEKDVATRNDGGKYPLWLTVELSAYQAKELKYVNEYREEVGVDPVTADPELMAFACWRAWHDASTMTEAHDWLDHNTDDADRYLADMGLWFYSENTEKTYKASRITFATAEQSAKGYRNSPDHYAAMVAAENLYFGCSDLYYSDENSMIAQFDLFAHEATRSPYVCK